MKENDYRELLSRCIEKLPNDELTKIAHQMLKYMELEKINKVILYVKDNVNLQKNKEYIYEPDVITINERTTLKFSDQKNINNLVSYSKVKMLNNDEENDNLIVLNKDLRLLRMNKNDIKLYLSDNFDNKTAISEIFYKYNVDGFLVYHNGQDDIITTKILTNFK
jgi:hypothetical protein